MTLQRRMLAEANRRIAQAKQDDEDSRNKDAAEASEIQRTQSSAMQIAPKEEFKPEVVDNTAMNRRYDTLRARAKSDVAQQTGEQQDALKRRFAQMGNLSSGAAMKQEQISQQKGAELQQRATEGIDFAQEQEAAQAAEQAKQRDFARGERISSQDFASQERVAGMQFAAAESALGRRQQDRQFQASQQLSKSQFGEQMRFSAKQFALEEKIQKFNLEQARKEANKGNLWQRFSGDFRSGNYGGALSTLIDPMGYAS